MSVDRSRLPVPGPALGFRFPAIVRHRLRNGLEIRAVRHDSVPLATCALLIRGGSAADPADRAGLTSFTADMIDEGVDGLDALGVADAIARLGADLDIDVGPDATLVGVTTLQRTLDESLQMLAAIISRPALADADFVRLRKLRLERLRQLKDHAPAVAERAFVRVLYQDHPYGHLGLGNEQVLEAVTLDELKAHHRAMYQPADATLVIAGSLEADALIAAAERAFGGWESTASPYAISRNAGQSAPPPMPLAPLVVVPRSGAAQTEIRIGHVCTSRDTPDFHALVLLNMVLGGQFVSRVNLNLREQKGYTYGVRTGFDLRRGRGPFVLQTSVQTEVTTPAVIEALREIAEVRGTRPVTDEELALARASLTLGYPRGFETVQQVARSVAQLALHGLPDDYFSSFVSKVEAVSLAHVADVAERYISPERMSTVLVGDHDKIAVSLSELGLGEPLVLQS